jgi:hypothetical protein
VLTRRRTAAATPLLVALLLALVATLIAATAPAARADSYPNCPPGTNPNPVVKQCIITVTTSSIPAPSGDSGGGGGPSTCTFGGASVPCQNSYGYWDSSIQCYVAFDDPQPPATDPAWSGHQPGNGSVWRVSCPNAGWPGASAFFVVALQWFAAPPAGPNPAQLAEQASAQMTMRAPAIATAPDSGATALVGAPVWVWDAKDPQTWGPQTVTVAAGALSVTATSKVTDVAWNFGDGTTLDCPTGGTPYQATYGGAPSPDCGHVYTASSAAQPGARYTLSATAVWTLNWTATDGETGVLAFRLTDTAPLAVGEGQAVVNGGTW